MKKTKLTIFLSVLIILMLSFTTNALALKNVPNDNKDNNKNGMFMKKHNCKYHKLSKELLLQNLGLTKEDAENAKKSGKSIFDLAKEKGKSLEDIKTAMIDAKTKAINQAVKDGKMTKEEAALKITKIKDKISKWDGTSKHKHKD